MNRPDDPARTPIEACFDAWLGGGAAEREFEALCRANPGWEDELVAMRRAYDLTVVALRQDVGAFRGGFERARLDRDAGPADVLADPFADPEVGASWVALADLGGRSGRFRRVRLLARGGMSDVHLVWDTLLDREVVLKYVRGAAAAAGDDRVAGEEPGPSSTCVWSRGRLRRFRREMEILARLRHPAIVPVFDVGVDEGGRAWIAMPRVEGQDLAARLAADATRRRDPVVLARLVAILERVCVAVAHAHDVGIVHRDLKPTNIRVGRDDEVRVLDWGIAKTLTGPSDPRDGGDGVPAVDDARLAEPRLTRDGAAVGTPAYMAPEQAGGDVGVGADIYAIGAMLHESLAGAPPHVGSGDTHPSARSERPPLARSAPHAPAELVSIAERALEDDPASRYPSVRALAADLRAWIDGRVVLAHPTSRFGRLRKWVARNRAVASLAALVVLVAGAAATWLATVSIELREARDDASARLAEYEELADATRAERRIALAESLTPDWPATVSAKVAWLSDARRLLDRRPGHERALAALAGEAAASGVAGSEDSAVRFRLDRLRELLAAFDRLAETAAEMEQRIVRSRALGGGDLRSRDLRWGEATAAIASSPRYGGLLLEAQTGLTPIGPDPESGLWEFAVDGTGETPAAGRVGDPTHAFAAVVLVLIPGGPTTVGSDLREPGAPAAPFTSPWSDPDERPSRSVRLAPYFIAKHEMTRAQWRAAFGDDPSIYDEAALGGPTARFPVSGLSHGDVSRRLPRLGLRLPSEEEWEAAARAGTATDWWTGDDPASLDGAANLSEGAPESARERARTGDLTWPGDGRAREGPVGSFAANPYGLHDTIGNLWEHVATAPDRAPPGPPGKAYVVVRGGSYVSGPVFARVSYRYVQAEAVGAYDWGVRPARSVDSR